MIDKKVEYGKFAGILGGIFLAVSFIFFRILTPGSYIPVITLILAILGLLIYLLLSFSSLQITFARKGVQRGILSLLRLVITGGILITVYILFKSYLNYSKDMTQDSLFTLSQQSKSVVESLSNPVQITVWSSEEMTGQFDRQTSLTTLLKFYQQASPKIQVRYLEPNLHPTIFRAYNLIPRQDIGSIVVRRLKLPKQIAAGHFEANILLRLKQQQNAPSDIQGDQKKGPLPSMSFKSDINDNLSLLQKAYSKSGNKYLLNSEVDKDLTKVKEIAGIFESVGYQFSNYMVIRQRDLYHGKNYQGESKITSAISNLEGSNNKVIYVTTGHGEKTFDLHYSVMKNSLSLESYIVKPITLTNQIPGDCDVLLMPGPTRPFLDSELNIINDYLKKGGKAMIMIDPAFEYARA
ncbi:MAG: GldG family protein, partial [Spirochaetota bacterium]|nr:GldG family protein [Spirochaetota bacterium]